MKPHRMCGLLVAATAAVLVSVVLGCTAPEPPPAPPTEPPQVAVVLPTHTATPAPTATDTPPTPTFTPVPTDTPVPPTNTPAPTFTPRPRPTRCAGTDSDANAAAYTRAAAHQYAGATESNCGLGERGLAGPEQSVVGDGDTFVALGCRRG